MKLRISCILCLLAFHISTGQSHPKREFRAFWVTTIHNLDWPSSASLSVEEQKTEFIHLIEKHQELGFNAIFVQVRAAADAFYKSKYEPWSQWLTKKQGKDPGYDPLAFMIEACHERNIEFHAWFNLYRAVSHVKFSNIDKNHISKQHPEWFYQYKNSKFFNPGIPAVKNYLIQVILDVAKNYDIDGVHLDDYFYPIESKKYKINDKKTYKKHQGKFKNIKDWRRYNNNILIKQLNDSLKHHKSYLKFGVSPFPVWRHKWDDKLGSKTDKTDACYDNYYADTRKWIKYGWVDYLAPQFYWGTKFKRSPFQNITSWWDEHHYDKHIYAGLAIYKVNNPTGDARFDPSWKDSSEIFNQLKMIRDYSHIKGCSFYRYHSFTNKSTEAYQKVLIDSFFSKPALRPTMPWLDSIAPLAPTNLTSYITNDSVNFTWKPLSNSEIPAGYVIYTFDQNSPIDFSTADHIFSITNKNTLTIPIKLIQNHTIIIKSIDRLHNESRSFLGQFFTTNESE